MSRARVVRRVRYERDDNKPETYKVNFNVQTMFLIFYASTLYKFNEKSNLKHLNYNFTRASQNWLV